MRRSDREIRDFDEILEVMKKCDVCRIAMQGDEYPYVIPLNFGMAVDGQQVVLYFHGAQTGMKYELLSKIIRSALRWTAAICSLRIWKRKLHHVL